MADRDTDRHYDSKEPPAGSAFEFYWYAFYLLDLDPVFPFAWAPFSAEHFAKVAATGDRDTLQMSLRINDRLLASEQVLRARIVDELRAAGVPAADLQGDMPEPVAKLVDRCVQAERTSTLEKFGGRRAVVDFLETEYEARCPDKPAYCRRLTVRVVTAARFRERDQSIGAVLDFLNDGARGARRFNRHHLRSVMRTWRADLKQSGYAGLNALSDDIAVLKKLAALKEQTGRSVRHPHLRGLKGRRLAEAMHEICDLREAVHPVRQITGLIAV